MCRLRAFARDAVGIQGVPESNPYYSVAEDWHLGLNELPRNARRKEQRMLNAQELQEMRASWEEEVSTRSSLDLEALEANQPSSLKRYGVVAATVLALTIPAMPASAETVCGGPSFGYTTDQQVVELLNATEDDTRFCMYENGEIPEAPAGYVYAEDITLVPYSYYDQTSYPDLGADLPYQSYAGVKPGTTPWVGGSAYDRYGNAVDSIDEAYMAAYDAEFNPINGFTPY